MQTYINDYLHQQKGLSVELATTVILAFGVGCAVGVIAGGAAGQALYNWWVQLTVRYCTTQLIDHLPHSPQCLLLCFSFGNS